MTENNEKQDKTRIATKRARPTRTRAGDAF